MATTQNNATRLIVNNPTVLGENYTYTLTTEQTLLTGVTSIEVSLSDANNDIDVAINTVSDTEKDVWLNDGWLLKIGDITLFLFVDGGPGLALASNEDLGDEAQSDADFEVFKATRTIEIVTYQ